MTSNTLHRRMDAARVRAELTVQDLWLRYLALTGTGDAFDIDGYLQGLIPMDPFQRTVLGQALNEALTDCYETYRIPLPAYSTAPTPADHSLQELTEDLLNGQYPDSWEQTDTGDA